ncbi:SDR family NAD(P)-dependent oxidoreductase [Microbacterium resistens]
MPGLLEGRAVVVTGAGRGLGRAYAAAAADAGAAVVVCDLDRDAAQDAAAVIRDVGGAAIAVAASVADPATGGVLVERCVREFGRMDGLVNNAGVLSAGAAVGQDAATVTDTLDVNVAGVIHCGVAALRHFAGHGGGTIVNVVSGALQGYPGLSLYGATKGAVMGLTYGWALEAPDGVRVNAVSPLAQTAMSALNPDGSVPPGPAPGAVAPLVVYLLSPRSQRLNGQIVRFDGRHLGLIAPPAPNALQTAEEWDAAAIAAAFDGPLGDWLTPVGMQAAPRPIRLG